MPKKPTPARLAEFQTYLSFFRAMWAFQEKLEPRLREQSTLSDGTSYGEAVSVWAEKAIADGSAPFSALLTGMKQGVGDQLEMTRDLPQEAVKLADEFLVAAGAPSLMDMRRRVWRVIPHHGLRRHDGDPGRRW
jgi:hypothetical protein